MGGKSSKDQAQQQARKGVRPVQSNRSNAWEKKTFDKRTNNNSLKNNVKHEEDTWGRTTYNLLDLQAGYTRDIHEQHQKHPQHRDSDVVRRHPHQEDARRHPHNAYANFRNITDQRNEEDTEKRRQQYNSKKKTRQRTSSIPSSPPPRPSPTKKKSHRSPLKKSSNSAPERRYSDVSTIEMTSPERRGPKDPRRFSQSMPDGRGGGGGRGRQPQRRRARSISPPPKNYGKSSSRRGGGFRGGRPSSLGAFTNLASVKSASQSMDSNASNFEHRSNVIKFNDKRDSLYSAGLAKISHLNNQFSEQRVHGMDTYHKAKRDLESDDWTTVMNALGLIVSISRSKPEILREDIKDLSRLMLLQLKNLRSQVSRAAGQAMAELYLNLGKAMEQDLGKMVAILLQKAADTNKFIRESCNDTLDVMSENVSVFRALDAVVHGGIYHKSVVVRTCVARIVDRVVCLLTASRIMGASKDLQHLVIGQGSKMLMDGSLDVRKNTKHMFGELMRHSKFDGLLREVLSERERQDIKKTLDSIR